ncbi:MAG: xanthine dehydrogenase family protein subunit M [Eubacteriales bacterium]|nr:xanthine dehydrogenase family protein subunit M [Eubacteriales bacterium]
MKAFDYLRPTSLEEAIAMRIKYGDKAVILNGGTDRVIQLRERLIAPDYVIDIKHIPDLNEIKFSKQEGLVIGACVNMNTIGENPDVIKFYPYLAEAALSVGSKQVRNRATCAGNIINASPLCDTGTPLYVADAKIGMVGQNGYREVPITEFITFVRRTVLQPDEIVTCIKVPYYEGSKGIFTKIARRKEVDLSTICGTVLKRGDEYKLAFGAVAPTPVRLKKTEELLKGKKLDEAIIEEAAALAQTEVSPISDVRASKQYRLDVVAVIVRRSLKQMMEEG